MTEEKLKLSNLTEVLFKLPPAKIVVSEYLDLNLLFQQRDSVPLTREEFEQLRDLSATMLEPDTHKLRMIIRKIMFTFDNGLMGKICTDELLNYAFVSSMLNVHHVQVLNPAVLEDRTPYAVFPALL